MIGSVFMGMFVCLLKSQCHSKMIILLLIQPIKMQSSHQYPQLHNSDLSSDPFYQICQDYNDYPNSTQIPSSNKEEFIDQVLDKFQYPKQPETQKIEENEPPSATMPKKVKKITKEKTIKKPSESTEQSDKHNFPLLFVRQVKHVLKVQHSNPSNPFIEGLYVNFVKANLQENRNSLKKYFIYEQNETQVAQQFKKFVCTQPPQFDQDTICIKTCKEYIRKVLEHNQQAFIDHANKRPIIRKESKKQFGQYSARTLEQIKENKLRKRDVRKIRTVSQ